MSIQMIDIERTRTGGDTHVRTRHTNKDKRTAVMRALRLRPELSDHFIAEHVGVCNATVAKYRLLMENTRGNREDRSYSAKRIGKDGKKYPAQKQRSKNHTISPNVMAPIRSHNSVNEHQYVGMSKDPLVEARVIFDCYDRVYLDILVSELRSLLSGSAGAPLSLRHFPHAFVQ